MSLELGGKEMRTKLQMVRASGSHPCMAGESEKDQRETFCLTGSLKSPPSLGILGYFLGLDT